MSTFADVGRKSRQYRRRDVSTFADVGRKSRQKHRRDDGDVMEMTGSLPRVVGDVDVAAIHTFGTNVVNEVRHGCGHRVDVAWCSCHGLSHHVPIAVEDPRGEIAGFAHRSRKGSAHQRGRLFFEDRNQAVPHDLKVHVSLAHNASPILNWPRVMSNEPSGCMTAL